MGKIIAIGGGFGGADNYKLSQHIIDLTGKKHPNYLQIPISSFDSRDGGSLTCFFNNGCDVDILYLTHFGVTEEAIAQKIDNADIIYVVGGNLKFCIDMLNKTNTAKYLKRAYEQGKVLCGVSTGAMCWFKEGYDDCGVNGEMMFYGGLGLLPYCCCPHYEGDFWHSFSDAIKTRSISGVACENDAALCFVDGKNYVFTADNRVDARCWFFNANDGFKKHDLCADDDMLVKL